MSQNRKPTQNEIVSGTYGRAILGDFYQSPQYVYGPYGYGPLPSDWNKLMNEYVEQPKVTKSKENTVKAPVPAPVFKELEKEFSNVHYFLDLLHRDMPEGVYVAGGSCISFLNPEHSFDDVDIFFANGAGYKAVTSFLHNRQFVFTDGPGETEYANDGVVKVNLVKNKYFKTLEDLLLTFDLECTKIGFNRDRLIASTDAIANIQNKTANILDFKGRSARKLLQRLCKYANKGYKVEPELIDTIFDAYQKNEMNEQNEYL